FFAQRLPNPHHYNQSVFLELDTCPDLSLLEIVLGKLVAQHDACRLRFTHTAGGWQQSYTAAEQRQTITHIDLAHLSGAEQQQQLEAQATAAQASLNISAGPLLRVVLFDLGAGRAARLLLVMHHLVIDGVSWRILLEDLQTAFAQVRNGQSIELPARTSSFKRWSESLRQYAASAQLKSEASYWLDERRRHVSRLPVDFTDGQNTVGSARSVEVELSQAETQALLQDVPKA